MAARKEAFTVERRHFPGNTRRNGTVAPSVQINSANSTRGPSAEYGVGRGGFPRPSSRANQKGATVRPATRWNSLMFLVTTPRPWTNAVAAIQMSFEPMSVPADWSWR